MEDRIPEIVKRKWDRWMRAVKRGLEEKPYLPLPALADWYEKWRKVAMEAGILPEAFNDAFMELDLSLETNEMEDQLRSYLPALGKPRTEEEREFLESLKNEALGAAKVVREALESRIISPREAGLYRRPPRDVEELAKLRREVEVLRSQLESLKKGEIPIPPKVVKVRFKYPWPMLLVGKKVLGPFKKGDVVELPRESVEDIVGKGYAEYVVGS